MSAKRKASVPPKGSKNADPQMGVSFFLELSRLVAHGWLEQVSQLEWHPHYQSPAEFISMALKCTFNFSHTGDTS